MGSNHLFNDDRVNGSKGLEELWDDDELSQDDLAQVEALLDSDLDDFLANATEADFTFDASDVPCALPSVGARRWFSSSRTLKTWSYGIATLSLLTALFWGAWQSVPKSAPESHVVERNNVDSGRSLDSSEESTSDTLVPNALALINFENKREGEDWDALVNLADLGLKKLSTQDEVDSTRAVLRAANPVEICRDMATSRQEKKRQIVNSVAEIDWGNDYQSNIDDLNAIYDSLTISDVILLDQLISVFDNVLLASDGTQ